MDLTWSTYNIEYINLNSNNIIIIPIDALNQTSKLRIFFMSNNSLTVFPNITFTKDSLRNLDLQFNFIGNIPSDNRTILYITCCAVEGKQFVHNTQFVSI